MDADVIVVGAGHNVLICAAYLARAGIDTLLVETRSSVGGCASTVTDLDARFNISNCDHTMVRGIPVADELDLASYGLRYFESEISGINRFFDGADPGGRAPKRRPRHRQCWFQRSISWKSRSTRRRTHW